MITVLITGANRGIGLEFCKYYLNKGYLVYACCRNKENAKQLTELLNHYPQYLILLELNLEDEESINKLKTHLKDQPIDILINNAGIYSVPGEDDQMSNRAWKAFFQVNSISPYLVAQTLLANIKAGNQKKIINISSNMGSISLDNDGLNVPYRASKAALNAITKSCSVLHKNESLIFISLHPGWVRTDMGGPNGMLSSEESVSAMAPFIDRLTLEDSGKYYSYDGSQLPW